MTKLLLMLLLGSGVGGYLAERQLGFWHPVFVKFAQQETVNACSTVLEFSSTAAIGVEQFADRLNFDIKDQIPDVLERIAASPSAKQSSTALCKSLLN